MGKEITVFTSGTWDLLHVGHLNVLERSASLGDRLIVAVSTDELIESYKGIKPIIPYEQRARLVASIGIVDAVVPQTVLTDIRQLQEFDVDIVTIGSDWEHKHLDGLQWMKEQPGKQVVYLPYTQGVSTTSIKRQIIASANDIIQASLAREQQNWTGRENS